MQLAKGSFVDNRKELVCPTQCQLHLFCTDEAVSGGISQLVQIHHPDETIRIDDDIYQQVSKSISVVFFLIRIRDDIAVPADQISVMVIKFTYLKTTLKKITGITVVQSFLGVYRIPFRNDDLRILVKDFIIFKQDAFFRNDPLPI